MFQMLIQIFVVVAVVVIFVEFVEIIVFAIVLEVVMDGLPVTFNYEVFVAKCVFGIFADLFSLIISRFWQLVWLLLQKLLLICSGGFKLKCWSFSSALFCKVMFIS